MNLFLFFYILSFAYAKEEGDELSGSYQNVIDVDWHNFDQEIRDTKMACLVYFTLLGRGAKASEEYG